MPAMQRACVHICWHLADGDHAPSVPITEKAQRIALGIRGVNLTPTAARGLISKSSGATLQRWMCDTVAEDLRRAPPRRAKSCRKVLGRDLAEPNLSK